MDNYKSTESHRSQVEKQIMVELEHGNYVLFKTDIVYSDDKSAVSWINKGTSKNPFIMTIYRLLFWICDLTAIYITGGLIQELELKAKVFKNKAWASSTIATY
ncbi:hypothetical protein LOTGIDRAFT_162011 [Lottia gigantea]|uniref:Uncharacterized protein n=1 Tax=Lottia gigantea TaxID=225164 RepID=V4AD09_LOTGI|nr:hypothetical protein LOTGIDRAFT_162011 [Lottia gigantea]ESO92985.1 hypothetical protein LOTGIDRAFT_162011 [Lottia gigantea]